MATTARQEAAKKAARTRKVKKFDREMQKAWADAGYPENFEYKGHPVSVIPEVARHWRGEIEKRKAAVN